MLRVVFFLPARGAKIPFAEATVCFCVHSDELRLIRSILNCSNILAIRQKLTRCSHTDVLTHGPGELEKKNREEYVQILAASQLLRFALHFWFLRHVVGTIGHVVSETVLVV